MKYTLLMCLAFVAACATVNRPDIEAPKGYEAKQDRVLGFIPLPARMVRVQSKSDKTRAILQRPAVWVLSICLPIALVAFAAALVLHNPSLTPKLASVALIAFLAAFGAGVWILATMWLVLVGALAVAGGAYAYFKFHGRGFKLHKEGAV